MRPSSGPTDPKRFSTLDVIKKSKKPGCILYSPSKQAEHFEPLPVYPALQVQIRSSSVNEHCLAMNAFWSHSLQGLHESDPDRPEVKISEMKQHEMNINVEKKENPKTCTEGKHQEMS